MQLHLDTQHYIQKSLKDSTLTSFEDLYHQLSGFYEYGMNSLSRVQCETLYTLVTKFLGEKKRKQGSAKLDKRAEVSLSLFSLLIHHDPTFLELVEEQNASKLLDFHLHRYVLDGSEDAKTEVARVVTFLLQNVKRLQDWKEYVNIKAHKEMEELLLRYSANPHPPSPLTNARTSIDKQEPDHLPPSGLYYDVTAEDACEIFQTDRLNGLRGDEEILRRREKYGENVLPKVKKPSIIKMFLKQLLDFMVVILIIASIVSAAMQDFKAAIVLMLVVIFNVFVGFIQEVKAERALASLMQFNVQQASVIRNSQIDNIAATELVPGDIVLLTEGSQVPADIRLIEEIDLYVVEALLTGEPLPIEKNVEPIKMRNVSVGDRKNMVFMSTVVTKGRASGVVVATGKNTEIGKISSTIAQTKSRKTILQKKLTVLGIILVIVSVLLCAVVVVLGVVRGHPWQHMLKTGLSLAVSVVPEGLVAVTTVTMSIGVQRMAKKHAIVRKIPAVETLGSITYICSDKTGTLTEGVMKVSQVWTAEEEYKVFQNGLQEARYESNAANVPSEDFSKPLSLMIKAMALCNNATIQIQEDFVEVELKEKGESPNPNEKEFETIGDPTEVALLMATRNTGLSKNDLQEQGYQFKNEFAFDSDRKRMTTVYSFNGDSNLVAFAKGASESILSICKSALKKEGVVELDPEYASYLEHKNLNMAENGLRVLAVAYKSLEPNESITKIEEVENDMCFMGYIGLIDSPRQVVPKAIQQCREAGINVAMITGDHHVTARAIATALSIIPPEAPPSLIMRGKDVDEAVIAKSFRTKEPFPQVFARVSPENKLQIVEALQARGEVVAMIGDGVNDASSIKRADVGVAMGKSGTDLAKQSASIILADDNFATIVEAIKEGRRTFDNIKKFVMYLLSCNLAEILLMLTAIIINAPIPFTPIQILYANLVADTPPALSLGIEPADRDVMKRLPRNPKSGIFSFRGWLVLIYQGIIMSSIALAGLLIAVKVENYTVEHARTFTFTLLTVIQLVHSFHSRSNTLSIFQKNPFSNLWLIFAFVISFGMVVCGLYIPGVNKILELQGVAWWDWVKVLIGVVIHFILMEALKFLLRARKAISNKFNKRPQRFFSEP